MSIEPALRELPKVELHVHLEGSMSATTVAELSERHRVDTTSIWPDGLPERFSFDGFPDFARQFFYGLSLLRGGEDLVAITRDLAATLAAQNVRYAEVTTTAYTHFLGRGDQVAMSPSEYRNGLDEGRRQAAKLGVEIGWVIDIPRDLEMPESTVTIDYLESPEVPDGLVAIGLGGYEVGFPAAPYAEHFARARALGLHSVPHAGETEGADSVASAIDDLGAERIGHGVRCLEDPVLVQRLVDAGVMLEVCPTSNDLLQVIDSIEEHAFPALQEAGLRLCINTDDPGWFATDLVTELSIVSQHFDVTIDDHVVMQKDAVDASFASAEVKSALRSELESFRAGLQGRRDHQGHHSDDSRVGR